MQFAALLVLLGGCSFATVNGPPAALPDDGVVDCTTGHGAVVVDGMASVLELGVGAGMYWGNPHNGELQQLSREVAIGIAIVGAIQAASAIYGYNEVSSCQRAINEVAARPPNSPTPANATSGMF